MPNKYENTAFSGPPSPLAEHSITGRGATRTFQWSRPLLKVGVMQLSLDSAQFDHTQYRDTHVPLLTMCHIF
ncbi:hypothetical protein [Xanthomonas fragariae]|uniref:hypothetical protein n=1 Tax=Xanthomonas fragariae TaxID=48664 RepID=UPI0022A9FD01|nr:hypothetical protein [Xanthomonas fragariae]WAT16343.1 hypothetical protein OZ429_08895 [Xanthomonas fragariae]